MATTMMLPLPSRPRPPSSFILMLSDFSLVCSWNQQRQQTKRQLSRSSFGCIKNRHYCLYSFLVMMVVYYFILSSNSRSRMRRSWCPYSIRNIDRTDNRKQTITLVVSAFPAAPSSEQPTPSKRSNGFFGIFQQKEDETEATGTSITTTRNNETTVTKEDEKEDKATTTNIEIPKTKTKAPMRSRPQTKKGSFFSLFAFFSKKSSSEQEYRRQLEDQVSELEIAIRTAKEETRQLRNQLSLRNSSNKSLLDKLKFQISQEKQRYEEEINRLLNLIDKLEEAKISLELALQEEKEASDKLQEMLRSTQEESSKRIEELLKEIEMLKQSSKKEQTQQLKQLQTDLNAKHETELEKLKAMHEAEMEQMKAKANQEIEVERAKMRKLVKAVAAQQKSKTTRKEKPKTTETQKTSSTRTRTTTSIKHSSSHGKEFQSSKDKKAAPTVTGKRSS